MVLFLIKQKSTRLDTILTNSEHRLADIHSSAREAHCEDNVFYFFVREFMHDKLKKGAVSFPRCVKEVPYAQCDQDMRFFIGLGILKR